MHCIQKENSDITNCLIIVINNVPTCPLVFADQTSSENNLTMRPPVSPGHDEAGKSKKHKTSDTGASSGAGSVM